jgi:hypothetical protein
MTQLLMEVEELRNRLSSKTLDNVENLFTILEDVSEHCKHWCGDDFEDEYSLGEVPGAIKKGIALMIEIDLTIPVGVMSESMSGMSQTFTNNKDRYAEVYKLWKPYNKKLGFQ